MTDEFTKEWVLETGREYVENIMRHKGELGLMIFAHKPGHPVNAYSLNEAWGGPPFMRDIAVAQITAHMKKEGMRCYLAVSEAWMLEVRINRDADLRATANRVGAPSEHPDRVEIVALIAGDATGTTGSIYRTIRKPNGKFSHLEEHRPAEGAPSMVDGRLADLLLDKGRAN
jgi:hypothetical protein